jgi:hypothetical protein
MKNGRRLGKVSRNVENTVDIRRQVVTAEKPKSKKTERLTDLDVATDVDGGRALYGISNSLLC